MSSCVRCGHDPDAVVLATWSFFVEKEIASLNARHVNGGTRSAQAVYRRERDAWQTWMRVGRVNQRIPAASSRRRVTLVRVFGPRQRPLDNGNFCGGAKIALDAMVREKLLVDDAPQWVDDRYEQRPAAPGERVGTLVTIEELVVGVGARGAGGDGMGR